MQLDSRSNFGTARTKSALPTQPQSMKELKAKQGEEVKEEEEETELLSHLDENKLNLIKDEFKEEGLLINEFLEVMLSHLEYTEADKQKITMRLVDLFREIDVNGDEHLEWHEFSNHIIELGMLKKDRNVKEIIKSYFPADTLQIGGVRQKHEEEIEKVYFFESLKKIISIEKNSKKFQVYSYPDSKLLCDVQAHRGAILAAEVVKVQGIDLLATTAVDLAINFWDVHTFKLKQIISTPEIQQVLRFARWGDPKLDPDSPELLYTGGNDAIIHIYDLKNFREKSILTGWNPFLKRDSDQRGHSGPIMDLLPIREQKILASGGLDGKICLWDAVTEKNFQTLGGESSHLKGITCLDWYPKNSWLIASGLDHDVFVFNTHVQEKIYTLKGHAHPLVGVKWVPNTEQLVTADISGMVKVWDVRTMLCCQSFNSTNDDLHSFTVTHPKKRIVLGAKTLIYYDYDEPKDQFLSDEKSCLKVIYNETLFNFVTLHPDCVKVWDARNGQLKATHRQLTKGELTACCLDDRERKLFLGDTLGKIFAINVRNGATLKHFIEHKKASKDGRDVSGSGAITDLGYCVLSSKVKVLVTSAECASLKIHDDSESDPNKSRNNEMGHHKRAILSMSIKPGNLSEAEEIGGFTLPAVVATASDDGSIMVINLASYRIEALLRHPTQKPFKKVIFMTPHDVLVASDSEGRLV